jgi:hypothetical protein
VATSRDSGATFTPLQRINDTPGDVRVGREQLPRVAVVAWPGGVRELHVVWVSVRGGRDVLLEAAASELPVFGSWRFGRGAHSFFRQGIIKGTDGTGRRLWPSIAEDSGHVMHVAWRDERGLSPQDSEVVAGRFDATEPVVVAHDACNSAMAAGNSSEIYLAWHQRVEPGGLGLSLRGSLDAGRTFGPTVRVSEEISAGDACPEDAPSLAVDQRGRVHVVWRATVSSAGVAREALFHTVSADGRVFSPPVLVPIQGRVRRPGVTVFAGSLYVAWEESADGAESVGLARGVIGFDGRVSFTRVAGARLGHAPALAASDKGVLLAWSSPADRGGSPIRIDAIR